MSQTERVSAEAQTVLTRALSEAWVDLNRSHFEGSMRPPGVEIRILERQLGRWDRASRQICLSERLLLHHRWGVVLEVLKHEMVHQYVHEVLGRTDEPPHGPSFRAECARRGLDSRASGIPIAEVNDPLRDKVLGRVQRLLALASSDNIHEAQSAMKAAQRLMLRHNIEAVETNSQLAIRFEQVGLIRQRHPAHIKMLSGILGAHFFVRCIWVFAWDVSKAKKGRVLELCGTESNLQIAAYVHDFVLSSAERMWQEHKRSQGWSSNSERRRYLCGVMMGFSESLETQAQEHQEAGLIWVGDPRVDDWLRQRHPRIRRGSGGRVRTTAAWSAGRQAGRKIVVHKPLTQKKRKGLAGLLGRR